MSSSPLTVAKRRKRKLDNGICTICSNPIVPERTMCITCLERTNKRSKIVTRVKRDKNRCARCPKPSINGTTMCQVHLDGLKELRLKKLNSGICGYCGKEEKIPNKTYCKSCKEKRVEQRKIDKENGICVQMGCSNLAELNRTLCKYCSEKHLTLRKALKEKVLEHYGCKCNCTCGCQVTNSNHLTVDHINNDGNIHRKMLGTQIRGGQAFYRWIIKNGFPKDLQILCYNCNCAKSAYGGCN